MATEAISADVKAANSKLAQFLRRREEEEMILQIGKRKPKRHREERLPGGQARWQLDPDWTAPTPMVDRPRTVAGATSFHFSFITISKQAVPTLGGKPVEGTFGKVRNAALDHSKYIERDGAAEVRPGADHAAYIERPGAAETLDPAALIREGVERTIAHIINETPTPDEAELLGVEAVAPEGIPSVFSNISDDPFERQEFWRAVERIEATPRSHRIILEPDIAPAWWRELETTPHLDPDFKSHALNVAEAYRQHMATPLAEGELRKPFEAKPYSVSAERAGRIIEGAQRMSHYNDWAPPFEFKCGRGGRIQFRMVAELPYELSAEDRALIVQNFCDHLATLEERRHLDGTPYKVGMKFTAVIHAPDSHNDSRNYHLHVVAYDRPCRYMPEHGMWDFEVEERYNHKGEDRVRYPHRQLKLEEVARTPEGADVKTSGYNFVPTLRAKFAEINNTVLKARGIKRSLDARKYTEMGIDRTPTQHLGTKAAALESIGVPTTVGRLNAIAIWSDAERAVRRQAVQTNKAYAASQAELDARSRTVTAADPNHPAVGEFRRLITERQWLIADVAEDRESIMIFDHLEAKAKSRAARTRQTCLQFLADIETGKADRSTSMMKLVIQDRWKGAQQHIESIDNALQPHREPLAKAARDIERREQRILEIDTALAPIRAVLEARVAEVGVIAKQDKSQRPTPIQKGPVPSIPAPDIIEQPAETDEPAIQTAADAVTRVEAPEPDQPVDEEVTEVEAPSIKGFQIIEPTIGPRQDIPVVEIQAEQGTPEGLEPLRPIEAHEPLASEPEVVVPNIDEPSHDNEPAASPVGKEASGNVEPSSDVEAVGPMQEPAVPAAEHDLRSQVPEQSAEPASPTTPQPETPADEPKIDGRRKVTDPTLFPLPNQEPPIKPGTSKAAYADFDALIVRVMNDRIPIRANKQTNGTTDFVVPSLTEDEQALFQNARFAHRANQRLGAIHENQQQEIQRLIRWISSQGQNPDALRLENRVASLGKDVKASVRTLFKHWSSHEVIRRTLQEENARRIEQAKFQAEIEKAVQPTIDPDLEARRREAEYLYPTPDQAFTPEVAEFIRLLREAAGDDQLREAVERINADPRAREDIHRHNVELATAYLSFDKGYDSQNHGRNPGGLGR